MHRFRPSLPSILALCALVLAFSGTAVAARSFVITSTAQIKPSVLKKLKGKRGPRGRPGPTGPANLAPIVVVEGPETTIAPGEAGGSIAFCPTGTRVVSGGGSAITGQANGLAASRANEDRSGWFTVAGNTSVISGTTQAVAYCAGSGKAVASGASSPRDHSRAMREVEAVIAEVESVLK